MSSSDELILLERVFLRVGSADTDEQLENAVSKFLPPVLLKLSSPSEDVRAKVMELLAHINKRIKNRGLIQIPVEALLVQYQDPAASTFITNFTIIYIKLGFPRLPAEKQNQLLPTLIHAAEGKPRQHQESLLFLLLNSLEHVSLPPNELQGKSFLGLSEKPEIVKLLLEIVMDLLVLPYGWTGRRPPGFAMYPHNRIVCNVTLKSEPAKLEKFKSNLVKLLCCGVFPDAKILSHLVVACGDSRTSVSNPAEMHLRKITGEIDWGSIDQIKPLYTVYLGSGEGDMEWGPASTRLKLKILPYLSRSTAVVWPAAIKVFFDALYGENTNTKLKSYGLTFCSSIIRHVNVELLTKVANVILDSGLTKLIKEENENAVLRQAFSVMGQLVCRVPAVARRNLDLLRFLFASLTDEHEAEMQTCVRDAMVAMSAAYRDLPDGEATSLARLLTEMVESRSPKCRLVAVHYVATALPKSPEQLYTLLSASTHADEDVSSEAKKALYGPSYKTPGKDVVLTLPAFTDLLILVVEKESLKRVDTKLHTEILFYLRLCLAEAAGVAASLDQVHHPSESSPPIARYLRRLHQHQPHLLVHYVNFVYRLLDSDAGLVALSCLLECVGCLPDVLAENLKVKSAVIKGLVGHSNEEIRTLAAQLVALMATTDAREADAHCREYWETAEAGGKDLERVHGALLALGYTCERMARAGVAAPSPKPIVKYVTSSHAMLVSAACSALGTMASAAALELSAEDTSALTGALSDIVLGSKFTSKIKERACSCLGNICIRASLQEREKIINKFIDSAKEVREIELHLSTGECIVSAVLGPDSPNSIDPWKRDARTEGELRAVLSDETAEECSGVCRVFLGRALPAASQPHPHLRQSCCFWLLAVTKHCEHVAAVRSGLQDIQAAFMEFLSDSNGVVQEAAGKGLALVYQSGDAALKAELLAKVVEQLTVGKRSVNLVAQDTKLFQEGELGKAPTGENLSTYKELCALASDLNQPDLIYKFMHLANHNAVWNSKKGAAYGVSSLVTMAGDDLETHLSKIVAKLYRYQYDPTPSIQSTMTTIWHSLTSSTANTVEKYHKEIFEDLMLNLTAPQWRIRISCCQALQDFMRGGGSSIFQDCVERIADLWKDLFRVMDDIHEGTREAATSTTKLLSKICVRHCEKEAGKSGQKLSVQILPVLLNVGIKHNVSEIRGVSVSTVSEIVKSGMSPGLVTSIVPALLVAAAELESTSLNALSVMFSATTQTQDAIDSIRASAVKSHFTVQTLARCVEHVTAGMVEELTPHMLDMLRGSVGLGSRIATAHFLVLLSHHLTKQEIQPFVGKFLGALFNGLSDRNAAIRKNYANTIGQLTRCAKDSSVDRLLVKLRVLYFEKEEDSVRSAVCYTLQAMVSSSQDSVKNRPDLTLPLVFFAKHQEIALDGSNKALLDTWDEVWDDVCPSQGVLLQSEEHVCRMLEECMASNAWANKAQAARAIKTLGTKVGDRLSEERRDKMVALLVSGLSGRTWDGKEYLLDALSAICKHSKSSKEGETTRLMIEAVLKECHKEKIKYRRHALTSLGDIVHTLEVDVFDSVYPIVMDIIRKNIETELSSEDQEESSKLRQELSTLRETAYETLGKSWPAVHQTQEKYRDVIVCECVGGLDKSTRNVQVTIMATLVSLVEKMCLFTTPPTNDKDSTSLTNMLAQIYKALVYSFGITKHTMLRKESLNLVLSLAKRLKNVNTEEYRRLENVFVRFSEDIGADRAPEVKSRFIDIKESFQAKD